MTIKNILKQFVFISSVITCYVFLFGCDAVYVIKGSVAQEKMDSSEDIGGVVNSNESAKLSNVEVRLYYSAEEKESRIIPPVKSNESGSFYIHLVQPPPFPKTAFLEFSKPGYQTKRVYLATKLNDPTVEIQACDGKEKKGKGCWIINLVMKPLARQ